MRKFLGSMFEKLAAWLNKKHPQQEVFEKLPIEESMVVVHESPALKGKKNPGKKARRLGTEIISASERSLRDFAEMMENPFLALSKKRRNPIIYESTDGTRKIKVTRHTGHFLASIYDWDIIIFVESKIQEILNSRSDIPPRTIVFPRHEILKYMHKHEGKKQQKDLENSLHRLRRTAIDTTIRNEDGRYKADFGYIDSWEYTERKDKKELRVTLSQWLYDGICAQGALLKVTPAYFELTSALKRFLYRTARKHAGQNSDGWEFSLEKLYEKSGSESELKVFKNKIKQAVLDDDIPDYLMKWIDKHGKIFISFKQKPKVDTLDRIAEEYEKTSGKLIELNEALETS